MALNNAIRRAASRFVPLVVRASAGSQRYMRHHQVAAVSAAVNRPSPNFLPRVFPSAIHHFSTKPKSDESLLRVLNSEIQCAVETQEEEVEVPEDFPFKIQDHPGQQTITLTREYNGENITVEVHMPDIGAGEDEDEQDDNDDEEEKGEQGNLPCIPMVVRVSKNNAPSLEFGVTAYPDEIAIDSLSLKDPKVSEDEIAYEGPNFGDLDEKLQESFHKYLKNRGIKPSTTNFLHSYMINKDSREYVTWLENLQKFVQA